MCTVALPLDHLLQAPRHELHKVRYWESFILTAQSSVMSRCHSCMLVAVDSLNFIQLQAFSIGFKSGLFPGHLIMVIRVQ